MLLDENASLKLTANSPTGLAVELTPTIAKLALNVDDFLHNTFTVNVSTPETIVDLGKIVTVQFLWISCDGPLTVAVTQNTVERNIEVRDFLLLNGDITALRLANGSTTASVEVTVFAAGARATNPGTPGIFSVPEE